MTILESCDFSDAQGDLFSYEVENIDEVNECALLYCQPGIAVVYDAELNRVSVKYISSAGSKINHPSRSVYIYSPGSVVKIGCCDYPDNSPDDTDSGAIFTIQDCPSIQEAEVYAKIYCQPGVIAIYGTDCNTLWIKDVAKSGPKTHNTNRTTLIPTTNKFTTILSCDFPNPDGVLSTFNAKSLDEAHEYALVYCRPGVVVVYGQDCDTVWVKDLFKAGQRNEADSRITMININKVSY
jgi:hypothetical protein